MSTMKLHEVRVWPYGGQTITYGFYAACSCGWIGTVYGRKLDASEDGKSHTLMYAWERETKETVKVKKSAALLLWDQAVAVLREDNQITQSSYENALATFGLRHPICEQFNVHPDCDCWHCTREKAEQEYEQLDAYRNFRDERLRGGGAWE